MGDLKPLLDIKNNALNTKKQATLNIFRHCCNKKAMHRARSESTFAILLTALDVNQTLVAEAQRTQWP